MKSGIICCLLIGFCFINLGSQTNHQYWHQENTIYSTAKPWAFWWWMGSAVSKEGIKKNLEDYANAGLGGVHIIPIYGVKGYESSFIPFLSRKWIELFAYTLDVAEKSGLGVDLTLGTGWPYGGKNVTTSQNAQRLFFKTLTIENNPNIDQLAFTLIENPDTLLQRIIFYDGNQMQGEDITSRVLAHEKLNHKPLNPNARLLFQYSIPTRQMVKRAAPGGEGLVVDPFSKKAISDYLNFFQQSITDSILRKKSFRGFYNDSYEVYQANWTPRFLEEFEKKRGYDLSPYLSILEKKDSLNENERRICADYYETLSDLISDSFTQQINSWCLNKRIHFRDQAHGSPGNWLDLYAEADIPETEYFGSKNFSIPFYHMDSDYDKKRFGEPSTLMLKFASSATNVSGKRLVSSETSTWLGNHFKVSLSQIKPEIDELFLSGINHVIFHGIPYSPPEAAWPGWLFYASTNYNQQSHFWKDLPALNSYITNCQTLLQNAVSDNDVLVYYPISDYWQNLPVFHPDPMLTVHSDEWLATRSIGRLARNLEKEGYQFDYISDKQLLKCKAGKDGNLRTEKNVRYRVVVVPEISVMPLQTLIALNQLANSGVKVIFENNLPKMPNGYFQYQRQQMVFDSIMHLANKNFILTERVSGVLNLLHIRKEYLSASGLNFIRKNINGGFVYFIANLSDRPVVNNFSLLGDRKTISGANRDTSIVLSSYVEYYDPLKDKRLYRNAIAFKDSLVVPVSLDPGESVFLISSQNSQFTKDSVYRPHTVTSSFPIKGLWSINFLEGKPIIPRKIATPELKSWTELGDSTHQWFSGKAEYTLDFTFPVKIHEGESVRLTLGDVREVASVWLNDVYLGKAWCLPFKVQIPNGLLKKKNFLKIEVSNLSANRIRKMDQDKIPWKKYYDINMVDISYRPFDASSWKPVSSGLLGPVSIQVMRFAESK